jgi:hypothetical protein
MAPAVHGAPLLLPAPPPRHLLPAPEADHFPAVRRRRRSRGRRAGDASRLASPRYRARAPLALLLVLIAAITVGLALTIQDSSAIEGDGDPVTMQGADREQRDDE